MQELEARIEALSVEESVSELLFNSKKARRACQIFLQWLDRNGGAASASEVSGFASNLAVGKAERGFTYSRVAFYRYIFARLKRWGFIGKSGRFNYRKRKYTDVYAPVTMRIPKRGPDVRSFWKLAYLISKKWNRKFEADEA